MIGQISRNSDFNVSQTAEVTDPSPPKASVAEVADELVSAGAHCVTTPVQPATVDALTPPTQPVRQPSADLAVTDTGRNAGTPRQVVVWPEHPALTTPAEQVATFTQDVVTLVDDMFATMYAANGIGLAANQIAVLKRVLVIDLDPENQREGNEETRQTLNAWGFSKPLALINPVIKEAEGQIAYEEGCLSVPGIQIEIPRYERVVVEAFDAHGQQVTVRASGLFAVALQHEMDHLDGKVFVDYLDPDMREQVKEEMARLKAAAQE